MGVGVSGGVVCVCGWVGGCVGVGVRACFCTMSTSILIR